MGEPFEIKTGARLLRRLFISVVLVFTGITAILFVAPFVVPQNYQKSLIEKGVSSVIGHSVKIVGPSSLRILPAIQIKASEVVILGRGGSAAQPTILADVGAFEFELGVLGFLDDEIDIRKLAVIRPQLRMPELTPDAATAAPGTTWSSSFEAPDLDWGWWQNMRVGDIQLTEGRVVFENPASGQRIVGDGINLKAYSSDATGAGKGVSITGSARVNRENVEVRIDVGAVEKLLTGRRLPVVAKVSSAYGQMTYHGAIAKRQYLVSNGRFAIEAPYIGRLESWLGPLFDVPVKGRLQITGLLNETGSRISLEDLVLIAGENQVQAKIQISKSLRGDRIDANMYVKSLDLEPFVSFGASQRWISGTQGTLKASWSRMAYGPVVAGPGQILVVANRGPGRIAIEIPNAQIFGGQTRANVQLAHGEGMTSFKGNLVLERINTNAFLTHFGSLGAITGRGDIELEMFSVGGTFDELVAALKGEGRFNLLAGEVHDEVFAEYLLRGSPGSVPFTQMIGSFTVHQGILEGHDLLLKAPAISLVGDGVIDLARSFVDVRLQSVSSEPGKNNGSQLTIRPFRINGPFDQLELSPEES